MRYGHVRQVLWAELCPSPKRHVQVLIHRTSECGPIWIIRLLQMKLVKMRLYWSRVGPSSDITGVLRRQPHEDRYTQGECEVITKGWRRSLELYTQDCQHTTRSQKESIKDSPAGFRGSMPSTHHNFGLLASRTVRQQIFVIQTHPVGGTLEWQPQETYAAGKLSEKRIGSQGGPAGLI